MPAIIPIPAFTDNYIRLVREGGNADVLARAPVPVFGPAGETIPGRTQAHAGRAPADAVDSFAELRAWKDGF